jgi:hypothetical protein
MNSLKNIDLKFLLILVLIGVIFFMRMCGDGKQDPPNVINVNGNKYQVIKRIVDTQYVKTTQTIYKEGKTIYVDTPIYFDVPAKVDTGLILKDYFAKYTYKDTLKLKDSLGYVFLTDTITKNKILNRTFTADINKIIIKDSVIVRPFENQFFIGGAVGLDKVNVVNFVGPSFILKTKQDRVFTIGVGYSNAKTISFQLGTHWPIKFKK